MTTRVGAGDPLAEDLSALVDGELESDAITRACARWRGDPSCRATWHAYQLIGDVLRSEDLASDTARDAAFLSALRGRLATEPVVLAPEPLASASQAPANSANGTEWMSSRPAARRRWAWVTSSAVAAGFVAVAGVLLVVREPAPQPQPAVASNAKPGNPGAVAQVALKGSGEPAVAAVPQPLEPQGVVLSGQVIRDAGLDRYLAAHKNFTGSAALAVPSAFLRGASVESAGR